MKNLILLLILLTTIISCKKEQKVFSIQVINLINKQNRLFANSDYKIYEHSRRKGLKLIHQGVLSKDEYNTFQIKVNPKKSYYYSLEPNINGYLPNDQFRYVIDYNNVPTFDDYVFNSSFLFDYKKSEISVYYILKSNLNLTIDNPNCNGNNDELTLKIKYLEDYFYNEPIIHTRYGCEPKEVVNYHLEEGRYVLEWNSYYNQTLNNTFYDTINLVYGDTTNYIINY